MRRHLPVLAAAVAACAWTAVPTIASAAPHRNDALTIHATPSQVIAGDPVLIFGRLEGRDAANQEITLYHRINPAVHFTVISRTRTDRQGRYEFTRAEGVVTTNRSWFVQGPVDSHSTTIHERVAAEVTLTPSSDQGTTGHPLTFTGHVTPDHTGSRIALQVQSDTADTWTTVKTGRVGAGSNYSITDAWRTAGARTVRTVFAGDSRNTPAASDPASIVIDQAQAPSFTINTSQAIVPNGTPATISGVLDVAGTSTPEANATVSLLARAPDSGQPFAVVQQTTTSPAGAYTFTVQDATNELYRARTITSPTRSSAVVFQGVQDAVSMTSSAATSTVGGQVTFSGAVAPAKAGHVIDLEKLGRDGSWHTVQSSTVSPASTYSFDWTFGTPGSKQFRSRIVGGPVNVGGASAPVTVSVSLPPVAQLPGN